MTHGERTVAEKTLQRMLEAFKAEADMDGMVTVSEQHIAEQLCCNHTHVWLGVKILIKRGIVEDLGRVGSRRVRVLQISEEYL